MLKLPAQNIKPLLSDGDRKTRSRPQQQTTIGCKPDSAMMQFTGLKQKPQAIQTAVQELRGKIRTEVLSETREQTPNQTIAPLANSHL
ncbi:hypothetical protein [Kamptonema sp. PCC 6506]|uniref:hypothetical protein n=1 Tax=Kamptonema sp. PCC 6506 TaxID=272129 RepID=UPI0001DAD057|nr:hypothetical protein [Kamptonema sp. PCC 6506]CBN56429.1 hypothetical protein OSCI_3010033 [Kamptonema sp. PCC 6506]